ncbi:MAG: LysM peptidoglycan-binding domain-containing protein [Cocleimonas sp.]|nr:LysM peptidoglycan-binding domain-containing protein [Cocleimonas sp.]
MNGIMDKKIKLLAVASIVAVMASGCSNYRLGNQGGGSGYSSGGSNTGQVARTGQVSRGGGLFGQRRAASCGTCGTNNNAAPKSTYTYKPAAKPVYKAAATRPAGQHNQQYYIDRWNRQQAAQNNKQNYTGYGSGNANTGASNTNYYDYSSAGKTTTAAPAANVSASNKSIYTGSYQQPTYKPYAPTTYSGGSTGTTNTANTYNAAKAAVAGGGSGSASYMVKKGDTVFEVMRQTGVYWKDIISMNNLVAPYTISPGQTLRLK